MSTAAQRWAEQLAAWRIPDEIIAQAPRSPWIHPVEAFTVTDEIPDTPSHRRAREGLVDAEAHAGADATGRAGAAPSVLDIGCGGGRAAFAVVPPARRVRGVDVNPDMLAAFAAAAARRGVDHDELLGSWPDVADRAPMADVVLAHHVAYNVADLAEFALAAGAHARRRVVLELPQRHPLSPMAPLWRHFWGLVRPDGPTADDALAVLVEAGLPARLESWTEEIQDGNRSGRAALPWARRVELTRIRLCLPADRDDEVAEAMARWDASTTRQVATLWWPSG